MEDVLEVYTRAYDARSPQICMDETPVHLRRERVPAEPASPGQAAHVDYQYDPQGVCKLFVACEPLAGRRYVTVTTQHTSQEWAHFLWELIETHYPQAETLVLVMDNLRTHTPASYYKVFPPEEARRLSEKLELHYTPKQGSWVHMVEIELSVLARQCLCRPIESQDVLSQQVAAWQAHRNAVSTTIDWRFTSADARIELKRLYPAFLS
jgi:hypothetical protein